MQNNIERLDEEPIEEKSDDWSWKQIVLEAFQTIILAVILYFVIDTFIARVRVDNISMLPTLKPGEFLIVNKLSYKIGNYERGDIIIFHFPQDPSEDYIKRLIGLPGDHIEVEDGYLYINEIMIEEDYLPDLMTYSGEWDVPADALFVLGDNRNHSSDSHSWGFVPVQNVMGEALVKYWPLDQVTIFRHMDYQPEN